MSDLKIQSERPLSMAEVKEIIDNRKKKEIGVSAAKTLEYINSLLQIKSKEAAELKEKIVALGITRLSEKHIKKIIDVMPTDMPGLKVIFSGENITFKQDDFDKILGIVKQYTK